MGYKIPTLLNINFFCWGEMKLDQINQILRINFVVGVLQIGFSFWKNLNLFVVEYQPQLVNKIIIQRNSRSMQTSVLTQCVTLGVLTMTKPMNVGSVTSHQPQFFYLKNCWMISWFHIQHYCAASVLLKNWSTWSERDPAWSEHEFVNKSNKPPPIQREIRRTQ